MKPIFVRVELNGEPDGEVYDELHEMMGARGLSQTIQSSRSGEVRLPHAMYCGETDQKPGDLARLLSEEIGGSIWTRVIVLVVEWKQWGHAVVEDDDSPTE